MKKSEEIGTYISLATLVKQMHGLFEQLPRKWADSSIL